METAIKGNSDTEANRTSEKQNSYIIRPPFDQKFRPSIVKSILSQILKERLENEAYSPEITHGKRT
ncbi:tctex1 domain-containing protein 2 [Clonorchis sinensis]|uniref:Tctex1 domain-containing protein 2 n=1 Tax=Clonorchis sinensis TaxID=79923 RepID=G7Y416_CLOSI|nr:tctex1 domain-containing protein 2 [Clonorchis sinensis]